MERNKLPLGINTQCISKNSFHLSFQILLCSRFIIDGNYPLTSPPTIRVQKEHCLCTKAFGRLLTECRASGKRKKEKEGNNASNKDTDQVSRNMVVPRNTGRVFFLGRKACERIERERERERERECVSMSPRRLRTRPICAFIRTKLERHGECRHKREVKTMPSFLLPPGATLT